MIPLTEGIEDIVFKLLPKTNLNALSATNKQLRQFLRDYTSKLKIRRRLDIAHSLNHSWSCLATLDLSHASLRTECISAFVAGHMPVLQHLNVSYNKLKPGAIQQLVQGDWPSLSVLKLTSTFGGDHAFERDIVASCQYLATATWPQLKDLDVGDNGLPSAALAELAKAHWGALQSINIGGGTHGHFVSQLAEASWPELRALDLHSATLWPYNAQDLQQLGWSNLTSLNLSGCLDWTRKYNEDAPLQACQLIAAGHWPLLAVLDISRNQIGAQNMADLAKGNWPALTALDVSHNDRSLTAALVKAPWTALQQLNFSVNNSLSPQDISALQASDWQHLTKLELGCIEDLHPIQHLRLQKWPQLASLGLNSCSLRKMGIYIGDLSALFTSLEHLDLTASTSARRSQANDCQLSLSQLYVLLQVCEPSLHTLRVSCFARQPVGEEHRPRPEDWPLHTELDLGMELNVAVLDSLAAGYWPVTSLCLQEGSDAAHLALASLVKLDLTSMASLCLEPTRQSQRPWLSRGATNQASLHLAELEGRPALEWVQVLATGNWPALEWLQLQGLHINNECAAALAVGQWPLLEKINLRNNEELDLDGLQQLANGNWPMLSEMDVSLGSGGRGLLCKSVKANLVQSFRSPFVIIVTSNKDESGRAGHELSDEEEDV